MTWNSRLRPSETVSVTCMAIIYFFVAGLFVGRGTAPDPVVALSLGVVRAEGLEPPRLSSLEPKSSASTNSATPAEGTLGTERAARLISRALLSAHGK